MESNESPSSQMMFGDEVVISGMSGVFPSSDNVQEFSDNLFNKVNMVTPVDSRWTYKHHEAPQHMGQINGLNRFDAQFFKVYYNLGYSMEPISRVLLEKAYEAIYDAGMSPSHLRNIKVGVFIGATYAETERTLYYGKYQISALGLVGCSKSMYANRISYWLDGKGPSMFMDASCAGSGACLELAYRNIITGTCDAAIVGGCSSCMHPCISLNYRRAGFVCLDGKTKCFDKNGDGCARSESACVLFLQRAKDAKRIYSEVYYAKTGYNPTEPSSAQQTPNYIQQFVESFYNEIGISPDKVGYVEANGAALPATDSREIAAIGNIFCKNKPIKIGSVKSNMGSSEAASGVCAIIKMCLAYHKGLIPGNLHYSTPLDIPEIQDNKVQVLTENTTFNGEFAAVNSFSYNNIIVHALLKRFFKKKDIERYRSSIPRLVLASGRQDDCVNSIFKELKNNPIDPEQIGLLHNIHDFSITGHMSRGYTIIDTNTMGDTVSIKESTTYYPGDTRPIWFLYSGMGSQWVTMGSDFMRIPTFANAIQKCHNVLSPKGIDIVKILTEPDNTMFDNILHSFLGIAAVQIGLTDILRELEIVPDNFIGHSAGEMGCAYADGCLTAEEMILSAYSRGLVSVQSSFIRGSMAAVGLGYKQVLPLCPPEIEVACHNSSESATISGPSDIMKQFVSELTAKGVFAKEVLCSNIAYHSRYIANAGPHLLNTLKEIIKNPRERSNKWVSTSVPQRQWNEPTAKYSSAEYHTNNFLNPVLFEEASDMIPSDAIVIEVAPHGLLQAIVQRSLDQCVHVPLTRRGVSEPVNFLLEAIGKLYQSGVNPKISNLYPKIEYPVSTGTPFLSHLVKWDHSEDWQVPSYEPTERRFAASRDFVMSIDDDDYSYLKGHKINGNNVFPESALLVIVWETLAMFNNVNYKNMSVVFEKVKFHEQVIVKPKVTLKLKILIFKGNNNFEVSYDNAVIVSGFIYQSNMNFNTGNHLVDDSNNTAEDHILINIKEIYKAMHSRGYFYEDEFQSLYSVTSNRKKANIKWSGNWITHLDGLFQFNAFAKDYNGVSSPFVIRKLRINVKKHTYPDNEHGVPHFKADLLNTYEFSRSGGVEMCGLVLKDALRIQENPNGFELTCVSKSVKSDSESKYLVQVFFAGPSDKFSDTTRTSQLEMDFSGINYISRDKIMGIVCSGAIATSLEADPDLLWPVPSHWTLADAATVPLPYAQAYYCLAIRWKLMRGQIILINAGDTALTQALIALATSLNCLVYVIVEDKQQKEYLMRIFPSLKENNVSCSVDLLLHEMNDVNKNNQRCDVIVTNASGEKRELVMKCRSEDGVVLDLSEVDIKNNIDFGMGVLGRVCDYVTVKFDSIFREENSHEKKRLQLLVAEGIAKGVVRPLTRVVFDVLHLTKAFNIISSSKHGGKVLIKIEGQEYLIKNLDRQRESCLFKNKNIVTKDLNKANDNDNMSMDNKCEDINNLSSGFETVLTFIDKDEYSASEPIVTMETLHSDILGEEELDPKGTYLILVPGFDGHYQSFTSVAEKLKVQALTLQLTPDMANDNISQMASDILKYIRKRFEIKSKFYLLGYSFGVNIALELTRILENEGQVGVVYCLDSSPDALRAQLDAYIGNQPDTLLQNAIIEHMYKLVGGPDSTELQQGIKNKKNWHDKVDYCLNRLRGLVTYSHQYKKCILDAAYKRVILAREYKPNFILQSDLILIKGVQHPNINTRELGEDYNLSKYTNKPVKVFNIESDHASILHDPNVSNIVNRLLDPNLLEEFKNKNRCCSYILNDIRELKL